MYFLIAACINDIQGSHAASLQSIPISNIRLCTLLQLNLVGSKANFRWSNSQHSTTWCRRDGNGKRLDFSSGCKKQEGYETGQTLGNQPSLSEESKSRVLSIAHSLLDSQKFIRFVKLLMCWFCSASNKSIVIAKVQKTIGGKQELKKLFGNSSVLCYILEDLM